MLTAIHKDQFDRILIATALQHRLTLVTPDRIIPQSPNLKTLWYNDKTKFPSNGDFEDSRLISFNLPILLPAPVKKTET